MTRFRAALWAPSIFIFCGGPMPCFCVAALRTLPRSGAWIGSFPDIIRRMAEEDIGRVGRVTNRPGFRMILAGTRAGSRLGSPVADA